MASHILCNFPFNHLTRSRKLPAWLNVRWIQVLMGTRSKESPLLHTSKRREKRISMRGDGYKKNTCYRSLHAHIQNSFTFESVKFKIANPPFKVVQYGIPFMQKRWDKGGHTLLPSPKSRMEVWQSKWDVDWAMIVVVRWLARFLVPSPLQRECAVVHIASSSLKECRAGIAQALSKIIMITKVYVTSA